MWCLGWHEIYQILTDSGESNLTLTSEQLSGRTSALHWDGSLISFGLTTFFLRLVLLNLFFKEDGVPQRNDTTGTFSRELELLIVRGIHQSRLHKVKIIRTRRNHEKTIKTRKQPFWQPYVCFISVKSLDFSMLGNLILSISTGFFLASMATEACSFIFSDMLSRDPDGVATSLQ